MTPAEAARRIDSGMNVFLHANAAFPFTILAALVQRAGELRGVTMHHILGFGDPLYTRPELAASFRHNSLFTGANMRAAINEGRADFVPIHLSQIESLFTTGVIPLDVALLQVAPPDAEGNCSLGVAVDIARTAAPCARLVIAEVNEQMPRTCGQSSIPASRIDFFVETSHPLAEIFVPPPDEAQQQIARHIASLIGNGDCLQTGIGAVPDAVLPLLAGRKNLGIHSEALFNSMIPLIESGAVNGSCKQIDCGKITAGFILGNRYLFELTRDNPSFNMCPSSYTNNPWVIAQNDNVVAINAAVEVDLTGQVCSDSVGTKILSGFGGQVDFLRGAAMSRGGRPILALPSTAKDGSVSRIVPRLSPGAGVVTSRADVHYVITEYGIVNLFGKNLRQRAEALISIAHPKFREELALFCEQQPALRSRKEWR